MFEFAFNNPKYSDYKLRLFLSSSSAQKEEEEGGEEDDIIRTPQPKPKPIAEEIEEEHEDEDDDGDTFVTPKPTPKEEEAKEEEEEAHRKGADIVTSPTSTHHAATTTGGGTAAPHADATKTCTDSMKLHGQQPNEVLHVCAAILAKDSLYFQKMFDADSFKESSEKVIDVWLAPCEKEAFLDVLQYLYTSKLEASTYDKLSPVWKLSDRFMVDSCVNVCIQRLLALPLSFESSCDVLEATTSMKETELLKQLVEKSLSFLADHFKNERNKYNFERVSPWVLELLLRFDGLLVPCEEQVYSMLQGWVKANCTDLESVDVAWLRFGPLVRWCSMEISFLMARLRRHDYCKLLKDVLVEALLYHMSTDEEKAEMDCIPSSSHRFRRRANSPIPLRYLPLGRSTNQGLTLFAITLEDWAQIEKLMSYERVYTQCFYLGGITFQWAVKTSKGRPYLYLDKCKDQGNELSGKLCFNVSVSIWDASCSVYVEKWKDSWKSGEFREGFQFEMDVDKLIRHTKYVHDGVTRVKAEVQVRSVFNSMVQSRGGCQGPLLCHAQRGLY